MFPLLETALAFAIAMLAASLFVTAATQLVRRYGRFDQKTTKVMLTSLLSGFLQERVREKGDLPRKDLKRLTHRAVTQLVMIPMLRGSDAADDPRVADAPGLTPRAILTEVAHSEEVLSLDYEELLAAVRYVSKQALRRSDPLAPLPPLPESDSGLPLPSDWFVHEAPLFPTFEAYAKVWYPSVAAAAKQQFRSAIRNTTAAITATAIIVLNLDSVHLALALYHSSSGRSALIAEVDSLNRTAQRLGVARGYDSAAPPIHEVDPAVEDLKLELLKTSSILQRSEVGVGWQGSWIVQQRGEYAKDRNLLRWFWALLLWFAGLAFSFAMLALGAPFWFGVVGDLLRWKNEGAAKYRQVPPKSA